MFFSFFAIVLILIEIFLRLSGLCHTVLFQDDASTGYILKPNQAAKRGSKTVYINEHSMRSAPLSENETRILMFGDSILYGGSYLDQSEIATSLLETDLSKKTDKNIRILNVSCGGWGIDNAWGYLQSRGDFGSKLIVLVFSSHDVFDSTPTHKVSGVNKQFPEKRYCCACAELIDKYILPRFATKREEKLNAYAGSGCSSAWQKFSDYCTANGIPLLIYLHAEKNEMIHGAYDAGGKWILDFAEENKIPVLTDLERVSDTDYHDAIHFSFNGQRLMADLFEEKLLATFI